MAGVTQSTTINASPEAVFNYVADIAKHGEWATPSHKLTVRKTSDGPLGQGSTFESVGHLFGEQNDTVTITEYAPNERVVYEVEGSAGLFRHTFEIKPSDGGVELTKTFDPVKTKMPLTLFLPMVRMFNAPRGLRDDLQRIKEKLEGAG